jgi:creatinine amidohydrolase
MNKRHQHSHHPADIFQKGILMSAVLKRTNTVQYELMFGREATEAIRTTPIGYLPLGCLERHGDHLPMGLDAIKAHKVCILAAKAIGGIVFPPHHYAGIHNMSAEQLKKYTGAWGNIYTDASAKDNLIDIIQQIILAGVQVLVLYSGHCPPSQIEMMQDIASDSAAHNSCSVIPFWESMIVPIDHAGFSETSFMLYLDHVLVDMNRINEINYRDHGWQEHNSPAKATPEDGQDFVNQVIDYLKEEIEQVLETD